MKYGITEEIQSAGESKSLYPTRLGAGFHDNCLLTHIGFEPVKEGDSRLGLRLTWENKDGYYSKFEWLPDADAEMSRVTSVLKRFNDIGKAYTDKDTVQSSIQGDSLEDLFKSVVKLIQPLGSQPVRLKLVLNDKDYAEFTGYPGFIENMRVAKTTLKLGSKERFEKTEKKGVESFGDAFPSSDILLPF